jgi:malate dehydrogenase
MTTVSILGAGDLGGAVAQALAERTRVERVLLIDQAGRAAAGKALDLQQAGAIQGGHTRLDGTDDISRVAGCAACVIADRFGPPGTEWQGDEALAMLTQAASYAADAPLVLAGTAQAGLLLAAHQRGISRARLIGSAPEALAAATAAIVALEAHCAPSDVMLTVLGAPPAFIVPWSEASVGGYALDRVLTQAQIARVEARAARLWPPGPLTLGLAAARLTEALIRSSRRPFSVLTVLAGEFGVRNRVGTLPAHLAPTGILSIRTPSLNTRERVRLETVLGG